MATQPKTSQWLVLGLIGTNKSLISGEFSTLSQHRMNSDGLLQYRGCINENS